MLSHLIFIILDEYCTHYVVEKAKSQGGGLVSILLLFGDLEESYYVAQAGLKGPPAGLQTTAQTKIQA